MNKKTVFFLVVVIAFAVCMIYFHRRVIRAFLKKEEMPKAPSWHFWVDQKNRRS